MSTTTSSERTKLGYGLRQEDGEDFWLFGALTTIKISAVTSRSTLVAVMR